MSESGKRKQESCLIGDWNRTGAEWDEPDEGEIHVTDASVLLLELINVTARAILLFLLLQQCISRLRGHDRAVYMNHWTDCFNPPPNAKSSYVTHVLESISNTHSTFTTNYTATLSLKPSYSTSNMKQGAIDLQTLGFLQLPLRYTLSSTFFSYNLVHLYNKMVQSSYKVTPILLSGFQVQLVS